ncbi:MAG TPA: helix-turn-helix transcriptional regulator [Patescibacteria group bacterium]|nr:helix-turn-helix transcriptional regulator [Patescibacteria group bacterium]
MAHHRLRSARHAAQQTQRSLGAQAGVSASTISHIECHRGPDVPAEQRRKTKTRLTTALKLSAALAQLPPGDYSLEEFVERQNLFGEAELYEALVNQRARTLRRAARSTRHLRAVA